MHTYKFEAPGCDEAEVVANSDWSGEATLRWKPEGQGWSAVKLPAPVVQALVVGVVGQVVEGRAYKVIDGALDEIRNLMRPAVKVVDDFVNKR